MNLDDKEEALIGEVIPAAAAFLGLAFIACTLVIAGLPPLPGFVGKFAMVHALLNPLGLGASSGFQLGAAGWTLVALLVASGLLALVALTRGLAGRRRDALHPSNGRRIARARWLHARGDDR